jgi:hypothetical protein
MESRTIGCVGIVYVRFRRIEIPWNVSVSFGFNLLLRPNAHHTKITENIVFFVKVSRLFLRQ